jgi:hypothetical protein
LPQRISLFDDEQRTSPSNPYRDDVVGKLSAGYANNGRPVSLDEWRFVSDDEVVAGAVASLYGGEVQEITKTKRNGEEVAEFEVFTKAKSLNIIIDSPEAVSVEYTWWANSELLGKGDGTTMEDGTPDPGAGLDLAERKDKAKKGLVPAPETTVYFRLADYTELGVFRYVKSQAWGFERNLARNGFYDDLDDAEGAIKATIARNPVEFTAKSGPRAGKVVNYTETTLEYKGAAE